MKKTGLIFFSLWLINHQVCSQADSLLSDSLYKPTNYAIKIKPIKGEKIRTVLTHFTEDSIFLMPFYKKNVPFSGNYKILREKEVFAVAPEDIKEITISLDETIISEQWLNENKSAMIEKGFFLFFLNALISAPALMQPGPNKFISPEPFWNFIPWVTTFITLLGTKTATGKLVIPDDWMVSYLLKGDKEKYREMLLELAGLKQRTEVNTFYKIEH